MTLTIQQIINIIRHLIKEQDFLENEPTSDIIETDWNHYLSQRRSMYPPEDTQEYKDNVERIKHLNASIICLIHKNYEKLTAEKTFEEIDECFTSIYAESNDYAFEKGILEGFILAFNLLGPRIIANEIKADAEAFHPGPQGL